MKRETHARGRIETHAAGVGTVDQNLVVERAREIAVTKGRRASQFNEADLAEAREELMAAQDARDSDGQDESRAGDGSPGGTSARRAKTKAARDEQTVSEELVAEGLDEASHELMIEGNAESRRRDARYEDQLPNNEP